MKQCTKCHQKYPEDFFAFKSKIRNHRNTQCKNCVRDYNKIHYAKNPATYKACSKRSKQKRGPEIRAKLQDYLKDKSCKDCGERDSVVLTFDHIDPKTKLSEVSRLISDTAGWDLILVEIAKCDIRCFNCHVRRTAHQFKWWKLGR